MPAVVSVQVKYATVAADARTTRRRAASSMPNGMEDFFKQFPQFRNMPGMRPGARATRAATARTPHPNGGMAMGSGFIISADGYAVTNNHVVKDADQVSVTMKDGTEYKAEVIGTDPKTDLALIKIDAKDKKFDYVAFTKDEPRVGDWVMAVGNPFGLGGTVTTGIVSALGRDIGSGPYDNFMQIDAAINRGNSGGPAFNLEGEVVGINTAIFSPSGGSVGIGFAIPASTAQNVIESLKENGKVTRGWLGVQIQPVTEDIAESLGLKDAKGAIVADVTEDSPALAAGVKQGDTILKIDGKDVSDSRDLSRKVAGIKPGDAVPLTVVRDGKTMDLEVKIGTMPDDPKMASKDGIERGHQDRVARRPRPQGCLRPGRRRRDRDGSRSRLGRGRPRPQGRRHHPRGGRHRGARAVGCARRAEGQRQEEGPDAREDRRRPALHRAADRQGLTRSRPGGTPGRWNALNKPER